MSILYDVRVRKAESIFLHISYRTLVWTNIAVSKIYGVCFLLALIECQMYAVDVI